MHSAQQAAEIRSVGLVSYGRWVAIYNGLLGAALAVLVAFIVDVATDSEKGTLLPSIIFVGTRALIGFVGGVIYGVFYNGIAAMGGLQVVLEPAPVVEATETSAPSGRTGRGKHGLETAFIVNASIALWCLLGLLWLGGSFIVENSYKDAKKHQAKMAAVWNGEGMISNYRCMTAAQRHGKFVVLYPSKCRRMANWVQEARLNLALSYSQQRCPLAAAVWASRYLEGKKLTEEGRGKAQGVLDYAKALGFTDEEIAAAEKLEFTCTKLKSEVMGRMEHGPTDWKFTTEYVLTNRGKKPVKTELLWDFDPAGVRGPLDQTQLRPGQTVTKTLTFDTKSEGTSVASDLVMVPIRACPQ